MRRFRIVVMEENPGEPTDGRVIFPGPLVPDGALNKIGEVLKAAMPGLQMAALLREAFGGWGKVAEAFSGAKAAPSPRRRPPPARKKGARR
jgi:hypothetical protein